MDNKTKAIMGLVLVSVLGLVGSYTGWTRPLPKPETVTVEKVITVDRIVIQKVNQVKTETRPDGTKIVTETKMDKTSDTKRAETAHQSTVAGPPLPKYSLGAGIVLDPFKPLTRLYEVNVGMRLWQTPIWLDLGVTTNKTVTLGGRIEF